MISVRWLGPTGVHEFEKQKLHSCVIKHCYQLFAKMLFRSLKQARTFTRVDGPPVQWRRRITTTIKRYQDQQKPGATSNYQAPPAPKSRTTNSQLPVIPLVAIFFIGSLSFYLMVRTRAGQGSSHYVLPERAPPKEQWPKSRQEQK